jgi:hypothetical protein
VGCRSPIGNVSTGDDTGLTCFCDAGPPRSLRSRVVIAASDEDAEEIATPTRRFGLLEITSGLPDDSREADEKQMERRLRDLRARVKFARAVVSRTPGLREILATDWKKAARFYARFGLAEAQFRRGVAPSECPSEGDSRDALRFAPTDARNEARSREEATLPRSQARELGGCEGETSISRSPGLEG